jgi:hypothetical protein
MKAAKKKMSIHVPTISLNSTGSTLQPYIYDVAEWPGARAGLFFHIATITALTGDLWSATLPLRQVKESKNKHEKYCSILQTPAREKYKY